MKLKKITTVLLVFTTLSYSQNNDELYKTIKKLDSLFFKSFNECDLGTYKSFLTEDFEFYHDKQGLTTTRKKEMESMKLFCGEQRNRQQLRRVSVKESLEVFPIKNFGAIQHGEHIFQLVINDTLSKPVSKAKFTNLWKQTTQGWKLSRSISYNHLPHGITKLSDSILNSYEGKYKANDRIIQIKKEEEILRMLDIVNNKITWSAEMLAENQTTFYLNQNNIQVEFAFSLGKVEKLKVYENGKLVEVVPKIN